MSLEAVLEKPCSKCCNTAIGKLGDSVEGLEAAIAYLRRVKF